MPGVEMFTRFLGPRYFQMAKNWTPTLGVFGATAAITGLYVTDWKAVLKYVPYYGGKFPTEPPQ